MELFTQTVEWSPFVSKTFDINTQYTAILTLDPVNRRQTFQGTKIEDITGLPTAGVENISLDTNDRSLVIRILFETTANVKAEARLLFYDEFNGDSLDTSKWDLCIEWDRQGRSSWRDDMVSVSDGFLRLKFMRDPELGRTKSRNRALADNWIRAGAVRTQTKDWNLLFSNSFGYYEARIKFPAVSGTWGAFWLMSPTQWIVSDNGRAGTEIDIIESIGNQYGKYNSALHWNGYERNHRSVGSEIRKDNNPPPDINIYDGEFHIFALDWSPSEYIFYINGQVFWRVDGSEFFNNSGINQNPNYIKFSVESAPWAGNIPEDFTEAEMLVDYVRVYNQPRISN
jgi:beta-glucanase (GH16 family)